MSSRGPFASTTDTQQPWLPPSSHMSYRTTPPKDILSTRSNSHLISSDNALTSQSVTVPFDRDKDEEQRKLFKQLYLETEPKIAKLFGGLGATDPNFSQREVVESDQSAATEDNAAEQALVQPPKKRARIIDEDNYDDDEEDNEEEEEGEEGKDEDAQNLQKKKRGTTNIQSPTKVPSSVTSDHFPVKPTITTKGYEQPLSSECVRKQLEQVKKATEEVAKRSFHTLFFTLENDRIAMLEQQQLEESEKQIDAEMKRAGTSSNNNTTCENHGSLSSANLGASSLTLKHLIARIDLKRDQVRASDAELRSLMNEVRKNRSKWASEENIHQEELYEAAEKVLSELKAMTEYSAPFLTRVNKRDAPDYYSIIKHPMDLGTMTKKLKTLTYKSKAEFVVDLDLIWSNCLKYNVDLSHPLRRNANAMRKEAEKLVPLIPDLVIRSRAELEAEERRKQNCGDDDVGDESDDEPIISSRGRKAGAKCSKARKTTCKENSTPGNDHKSSSHLNGVLSNFDHDGSDTGIEGSQNEFATSPTGSRTPTNGLLGHESQSDAMEVDRPLINGLSMATADDLQEDEEYKIWKQVTKKDRALIAKERNSLFKGDKLNPDEPALVRTKAGMRRWLRKKMQAQSSKTQSGLSSIGENITEDGATLAEGMEGEEDRVLPDYYDYLSAIPDIPARLQWHEDSDGQLIDQSEDFMRIVPRGLFTAPRSFLTSKFEANMRQMQETRKLCSKIGVIKQMQLQAQTYNNQFPKYEPEPFVEADIEPHVVSDDGPIMATWVCKTAMQRSIAKICYAAGFEELQPSALDVITDIAGDYFGKIVQTLGLYREVPKIPVVGANTISEARFQERFTDEEVVLHTLSENGLEIETLESYVKDDVERLGLKLGVMHERMKAHLSDLLRPALVEGGADGSGAFKDGSDQFIGGDFADELGEDFFGFKALGLDSEFGMSSLSVPLHLLHSRLYNNQPSQVVQGPSSDILQSLPKLKPITKDNVNDQIGLVRNFFLAKLHANSDAPLIEDEDLPPKQRPSRPRLGPTGKITSPRKRTLKDAVGNSKKKKRLENGVAFDPAIATKFGGSPEKGNTWASAKTTKLASSDYKPFSLEGAESSRQSLGQVEKDDVSAVGMMSPESIEH
ncbi:Transcriptional activator spt7 [Golovinomyces cichoracearum]|uniref:SAGA complex subunit Spt7 n=1 Tax=Golovinomyces cichoracearum TaxID=62708 RepID=A0A420IBM9_9PEZI|nr:Transcriptional activator spt7 [Golovinomyces cichoracearum]